MIRVPRPQTDLDRALDLAAWANLGMPWHLRVSGIRPEIRVPRCMALKPDHTQCELNARFPEGGTKRYCLVHYRKYLEALHELEGHDGNTSKGQEIRQG